MSSKRIVLWGATGFTGKLVAECLMQRAPSDGVSWALGGRNHDKLQSLRQELARDDASANDLELIVGNSHDRGSMDTIARDADVVCSTVGPYAQHGSELVAACAEHGTDYCDLTGEVPWIRAMIDAHHERARDTGARIVHCCGFDSIPSDIGCAWLQEHAEKRFGRPAQQVCLYVDSMRGGSSGGTVASMLGVLDEAQSNRKALKVLFDPYSLNPDGERQGPDGRDPTGVGRDPTGRWTGPFIMAAINTRVVRRSNALLDYPYGRDFRYQEQLRFSRGPKGLAAATAWSAGMAGFVAATRVGPLRALLERRVLPSPGEGPSRQQRDRGGFRITLVGRDDPSGTELRVRVIGTSDPGYGQTSKMLAEAALALATGDELTNLRGVLTPAACFGTALVHRLEGAGMRFEVDS